MDGLTSRQTDRISPLLYKTLSLIGSAAPPSSNFSTSLWHGKGTADLLMPLGDLLECTFMISPMKDLSFEGVYGRGDYGGGSSGGGSSGGGAHWIGII